jgi:hypothetical protein
MGAMATFAGYDKLASHVDRRLGNVPVAGSSPGAPKMTVAFAAIHQSLRYRGEDTKLYVAAFDDGTMFVSRRQPALYDALARMIAQREVPPGSYVNVRYHEERGINRMDAIQLVRLPEEEPPFDPVPDDGHL